MAFKKIGHRSHATRGRHKLRASFVEAQAKYIEMIKDEIIKNKTTTTTNH
jgi:hypothetical protein